MNRVQPNRSEPVPLIQYDRGDINYIKNLLAKIYGEAPRENAIRSLRLAGFVPQQVSRADEDRIISILGPARPAPPPQGRSAGQAAQFEHDGRLTQEEIERQQQVTKQQKVEERRIREAKKQQQRLETQRQREDADQARREAGRRAVNFQMNRQLMGAAAGCTLGAALTTAAAWLHESGMSESVTLLQVAGFFTFAISAILFAIVWAKKSRFKQSQ